MLAPASSCARCGWHVHCLVLDLLLLRCLESCEASKKDVGLHVRQECSRDSTTSLLFGVMAVILFVNPRTIKHHRSADDSKPRLTYVAQLHCGRSDSSAGRSRPCAGEAAET